ncbi:MAG: sugar ABC transporter ATP-binding protein [Deltaproteobacteria bacterium]|nr:sugar ABC transporter ATP-binding protein [Deltaproteobacteria bacterium]
MEESAGDLVRMESVSKGFPGVQALDHVSLACEKGEIHALVGENGAGKSTVTFRSPHAARMAGLNIVHQEFSLVPYMSVAENILLGQEECNRLGLVKSSTLRRRAMEALDMVNVKLDTDALVVDLTASQQKLVEIAKALAARPDILVVDEPTAPLTKKETMDFFRVLKTLKEHGTTVIYISHRLEEIFEIADRVTVLKDGKKVSTKRIEETDEDDLIRMMIGRDLGDMFPGKALNPGEEIILSLRHIERKGELFDVDLDLHKGEILGIAGLKGQGQDVLLKTIFGALPKDHGEIRIDGKRVTIGSPAEAIARGMALVTDKRASEGLCPLLSVRDNLALPTLNRRQYLGVIKKREETATVEKTVKDLNIQTPSLRKLVKFLSGGNQQKIVVGKWLVADPRIVLFIDPTVGIDVGAKTELYRLMRELAEQRDIGVIVVTSDMLELLGLCDRILVMYEGRIVSEVSGKDATEEEIMRAAVGRAHAGRGNAITVEERGRYGE